MLYSDVDLVLLACWNRAFGDEGVAEFFGSSNNVALNFGI